jgi:cysteinyl-tRNA synthetase
MKQMKHGWLLGVMVILLLTPLAAAGQGDSRSPAEARLAEVETWLYLIDVNLDEDTRAAIIASDYDMVVMDPIITEMQNEDFPITETVRTFQEAGKLVVAYMDIGQAEDYRTYWQPDWRIGNPVWIVGDDPDGWTGNYPVAFWWDEWQAIWFDPQDGLLQMLLDVGFDGIYMDWVEAYSDENVVAFAETDGVAPVREIIWYIDDISAYLKAQREDFIVIAQNAAELVEFDDYLAVIDGIAQEATWFDGAADGLEPEGDCPMPATDDDIDTPAYRDSLSAECLYLLDTDPESQLHTSTAEYIGYLTMAYDKGEIILTVDYALEPANVAWLYAESRARGFIPFVGPRALDRYLPPVAP